MSRIFFCFLLFCAPSAPQLPCLQTRCPSLPGADGPRLLKFGQVRVRRENAVPRLRQVEDDAKRSKIVEGLGARCPCRLFAASLGVGAAGDTLVRHLQLLLSRSGWPPAVSRLASLPASMSGAAALSRPCRGWRARDRQWQRCAAHWQAVVQESHGAAGCPWKRFRQQGCRRGVAGGFSWLRDRVLPGPPRHISIAKRETYLLFLGGAHKQSRGVQAFKAPLVGCWSARRADPLLIPAEAGAAQL